jgi:(4-(4-[2-(gamma-L-glutamylamino)ethyl]phenoxymethyl)furan-2-yl)methanamine synthase
MGDVHVWRGRLRPDDYSVSPPDGRPVTREYCGERLARVVCADRELIDDAGVAGIADAAAEAQVSRIAAAVERVRARHPSVATAVVTGLGAFIAAEAARRTGLRVVSLEAELGADAARCAPAAAVALLLEQLLNFEL